MSGWDVVVLVAAVVGAVAALVALTAAAVLVTQVRRLELAVDRLTADAAVVLAEARRTAGYASNEMARVDAVLEDTESVTATVDSASRLARRAFANPMVKLLAIRAGAARGMRELQTPAAPPKRSAR
jgi:hypothetical protein